MPRGHGPRNLYIEVSPQERGTLPCAWEDRREVPGGGEG